MFNKSKYSQTMFGRVDTNDVSLTATLSSVFEMEVAFIKLQVKLDAETVSAEMGMSVARLGMMLPIDEVSITSEYGIDGKMYARIPLPETSVLAEYGLSVGTIRTAESEEMVLEGLNLAPGQTLIIDTDTLEIEVDNVVRVDCWVTGGTFFQFKAGENSLSFTDNAENRQLLVTVLWADRYL